jgi:hypothetical protein
MNITDILFTLLFTALCYLCITKMPFFRSTQIPIGQLYFYFTLHIFAAIALYIIYTRIYSDRQTADIFKFYDDAELLYKNLFLSSPIDYFKLIFGFKNSNLTEAALSKTSFWYKPFQIHHYNDNQTIIRFNLIIRLFSQGIYGIHAVLFTFLSFTGLVAIYKGFRRFFTNKLFALKIACFLIPSVHIWTSGILKESILIFALGIVVLLVSNYFHDRFLTFERISILAICIGLLLITKSYIFALLVPSFTAVILWELNFSKNLALAFLSGNLIILIPFLILGNSSESLDISHIIYKMQEDFINVANLSQAKSYFQIALLDDSFVSIIIHVPEALFNSLLRPFSFFNGSILSFIASIENLFVIGLLSFAVFYRSKIQDEMKGLWLFLFGFCLLLFILIGLTVPVEGAIVRYKTPALPFLLILLFSTTDARKINIIKNKIQSIWLRKLRS